MNSDDELLRLLALLAGGQLVSCLANEDGSPQRLILAHRQSRSRPWRVHYALLGLDIDGNVGALHHPFQLDMN